MFHESLLTPYKGQERNLRPPPELMEEDDVYEVERILDKRRRRNRDEWLVKWVGYPTEEATWEPVSNLKGAKEALREFER